MQPSKKTYLRYWLHYRGAEFALLGLIFFLYLVASGTQIGWVYLISCFLASLFLYNGAKSYFNLQKIKLQWKQLPPLFALETNLLQLELINESKSTKHHLSLYPLLQKEQFDPKSFSSQSCVELAPDHRQSLEIALFPQQRGLFSCDRQLMLLSSYPFHLVRWLKPLPCEPLVVLPASYDFIHLHRLEEQLTPQLLQNAGTSDEFLELNDYQLGDDLRHVYWPSAARVAGLKKRTFCTPKESPKPWRFAFDPQTRSYDPQSQEFEWSLSVLTSLFLTAKKMQREPELLLFAKDRWKIYQKLPPELATIKPIVTSTKVPLPQDKPFLFQLVWQEDSNASNQLSSQSFTLSKQQLHWSGHP